MFSSVTFSGSFGLVLPSLYNYALAASGPLSSEHSVRFSALKYSGTMIAVFLPDHFFTPATPGVTILFSAIPRKIGCVSSKLTFGLTTVMPQLFSEDVCTSAPF